MSAKAVAVLAPTAPALQPALADIEARTRELCVGLSTAQLRWRPPGGGWSVGQVLEHLVLTHESYLERMRAALQQGRERARTRGARAWKPTWLGGFIVRSLRAPRKVKTGRRFDPGPEAGAGAVDRFLATVRAVNELLQASDGADLRVRFVSPIAAIVRPNLGDAFRIIVVHAQRHLAQIERVMAEPGFPGEDP